MLGALTRADHNGRGRGQAKRARAGDDDNRSKGHQSEGQRSAKEEVPNHKGQDGKQDDNGDKAGRNLVSKILDGGFAALRFFHQADDLR